MGTLLRLPLSFGSSGMRREDFLTEPSVAQAERSAPSAYFGERLRCSAINFTSWGSSPAELNASHPRRRCIHSGIGAIFPRIARVAYRSH